MSVVTGAFQATGYGEQAVQWLAHVGLNLQSPLVLTVVTAVFSNLINNSAAAVLLVKRRCNSSANGLCAGTR